MRAKVFSRFIDYHDTYKVDVEVQLKSAPNGTVKGSLTFGGGQYATLSTKDFFSSTHLKDETTIRCQCDSFHYLLVNCKFNGFGSCPDYVIRSSTNTKQKFKSINVLLKGFTEWVIGSKSISWSDDGSTFSYSRESKRFSLDIENYNGNKIRISNDYLIDSPSRNSGLEINEYCVISIDNLSGYFTPEQVKDVVIGARRVFSILTGFPLDIQFIYDAAEHTDKSLYFTSTQSVSKTGDYYNNCLYRSGYLFSGSGINTALHNYFAKNKIDFDESWGRLYGLLDYRGFWENKLLLAVSFLDKASTDCAAKIAKNLKDKSPFKAMRRELGAVVDSYETSANEEQLPIFSNLRDQISHMKFSKLYSFDQKYKYLMQSIGPEIPDVIALSDENFQYLKKIRNFLAHGEPPPINNPQDIASEMILVNKVTLLLFYLAHKDLGLSDSDFLNMLQSSFSPLVRGSVLNQAALKSSTKTAIPIKVSKTAISQLRASKSHNLVMRYSHRTKAYIFERELSRKLNIGFYSANKTRKKRYSSVQDFLFTLCDPESIDTISYVSSINLIAGQTRQHIHSALLINAPIDDFGDYDAGVNTYYRDPFKNILINSEKFKEKNELN